MNFIHTKQPQHQELSSRIIDGRRWYTTPTGVKLPSITTILGHEEKEWLTAWKRNLGDKKAEKEQKRCAERGDAVHLMAEKYLKNDTDVTKGQETDHIFLFNKLTYALDKIDNIRAQEIPMYSMDLQIAGRCDCVAEFNGVLSIIDFKTSTKVKKENMVEDYKLQLSGYSYMWYELFGTFIEQGVILIATEKGLFPSTFKIKTKEYIVPLIERINTFYNDIKYIPK